MGNPLIGLIFISFPALAFVSGPSTVNGGENYLYIGSQNERGKIEPNENRASFQDAQIDLTKLKYVHGFDQLFGVSRSSLYFEYNGFQSKREQVGSNLFYDEDKGNFMTLGYSADLVHDLDKLFGIYLQYSPTRSYNKLKFSNPRIDQYSVGIYSAFQVTENFFQKNLIHFGSGDGTNQNSYLAVDSGFGYKLNQLLGRQLTVSSSLFLEADTSERFDSNYDAVFSPAGTQDRVRAFKYGTVLGFDLAIFEGTNLTLNTLQKLGGYDARSTQIVSMSLGFKF